MPIKMEIREEGWVVYYALSDPWTIEELMATVPANLAHRNHTPHTVHALFNTSGTQTLPPKVLSLRNPSPELHHPRSGQVALVGANAFVKTIVELIFRLSRSEKFKFFATEDEAWAYLQGVIAKAKSQDSAIS